MLFDRESEARGPKSLIIVVVVVLVLVVLVLVVLVLVGSKQNKTSNTSLH